MIVNVSAATSDTIHGEKEGYQYDLMTALFNNTFVYRITTPEQKHVLVTLDVEAISSLVDDPALFYKKHVCHD